MALTRTPAFCFATMVTVIFLKPRPSSCSVVPRCRPGYCEVEDSCVPCSKSPTPESDSCRIYCGGVCGKGAWGLNCDKHCNTGCSDDLCNRWTGYCIHGCKGNLHGNSCNIVCPKCEFCDDGEGGIGCVCVSGYYGDLCQHTCPANCKNHTCTSKGICTGGCTQRYVGDRCDNCPSGWYGLVCSKSCIGRCVTDLCAKNGSCINGCIDGVWGDMCNVPCPEGCQRDQCYPSTGICVFGCITGLYGEKCDRQCPEMCLGGCRMNGSCFSCPSGYTGQQCNRNCSANCNACHQDVQKCTSCSPIYYGDLCHLQCGNCLTGDCDILNGSCASGCIGGWYGDLCNMSCPDNCKDVTGCRQDSGRCFHGCKAEWYGTSCESRCSPGCKEGRCETDNGRCVKGCSGSVYGAYCNNSCSSHCINTQCVHVEDTDTVVCTEGCGDGWQGPYCQEAGKTPFIVFSVCIIVVAICVIGILARRRTRCLRAQSQLYISPTSSSVAYSTRTNTSLVTKWLHGDTMGDATDVTVNEETRANNDVMSLYEPVDSGCYDTADQQSGEQYCDVHSCSSQEGIYAVIPNSHFE